MNVHVEKLMGKLIVSCQAYEGTPLYGSDIMKKMAQSALLGGASGIRACWTQDVSAIRSITDVPIIGIDKVSEGKSLEKDIIITPDFESAKRIIEAGADIIALDCTLRGRTKEELYSLLERIKDEYPDVGIMCDISNYEEAVISSESNMVDIISTTLAGYTFDSSIQEHDGPDIALIKRIKKDLNVVVNAEGRIWEVNDLKDVINAGADMVTIGTAITRPHETTARFVDYMAEYKATTNENA